MGEVGLARGETVPTALFNSERLHNLVLCTLCSCYPRSVLAEFGTVLPEDVELRMHDSNAELRDLVVPARPAGTEGGGETLLATLVTRDTTIGVTPARSP
mgnify:CR=1 FL=1